MINLFGHNIEVITEMICRNSPVNHNTLVQEARVDWMARNNIVHVDDAYVLCTRCGKALSLKL